MSVPFSNCQQKKGGKSSKFRFHIFHMSSLFEKGGFFSKKSSLSLGNFSKFPSINFKWLVR